MAARLTPWAVFPSLLLPLQVVWKLSAMELRYPQALFGSYLTLDRVCAQLVDRYNTEYLNGRSSAIKAIVQRDQPSSKPIILCLSGVLQQGEAQVELTDGWYSIPAKLDHPLLEKLHQGHLRVGQKVCLCGALEPLPPPHLSLTLIGPSSAISDDFWSFWPPFLVMAAIVLVVGPNLKGA